MAGTVLMAIAGLSVTLVGLTLANADSRLRLGDGGREPEFRGFKSTGSSLTFLCVLHNSFTNSGFQTDYIDRIDIHSANLDETLRGDSKFVDRTPLAWRETRELRFEVLVTVSLTTYNWRNFLVTFYDSKGRQVAQTPFTTRFLKPGDLKPKVRQMATLTDGVSDVPPPSLAVPTLIGASLSASVPKRYRDRQCRVFAKIVSASGQVAAVTDTYGELGESGRLDAKLKVVSRVDKLDQLGYMVYISPPRGSSTRDLSNAPITVNWTRMWSDGTTDASATKFILSRHQTANNGAPKAFSVAGGSVAVPKTLP
jgi:hypothetical protein